MTTRRRFLAISAAALVFSTPALAAPIYTWQGVALGARVTLRLSHPDAPAIGERVAKELSRLEDVFSLYRPDSALSRLNRTGALQDPPFEFLECLSLVGTVHRMSEGRFDPTVQPLWAAYAAASEDGEMPDAQTIASARALVGWERVVLGSRSVELRSGMALTLNGIAQGYIADRVAALLKAEGLGNILIDTGEFHALGSHPEGGAWQVRLAEGGQVGLTSRALATSAPLGTTFDEKGQAGHILDPLTGRPTRSTWRAITLSAPSAALADALSTAGCLYADRSDLEGLIANFDGVQIEAAVETGLKQREH